MDKEEIMAKENITVEDLKKARNELELSVLDSFKEFEKEFKVHIRYIDLVRKDDGKDMDMVEREKKKPLVDINVNMDIMDLI